MIPFWISLAGGLGAVARFTIDGLIRAIVGRQFPWGTLIINISGSLVLGMMAGLVLSGQAGADAKLIIGTGFCGGFTTFSTASFESVRLIEERRFAAAWLQVLGNLGFTIAAAAAGLWLTLR